MIVGELVIVGVWVMVGVLVGTDLLGELGFPEDPQASGKIFKQIIIEVIQKNQKRRKSTGNSH